MEKFAWKNCFLNILAPNQYETNVEIASGKRVEFAIKLPGNGDSPLFLPIDSKFPIEDYNRLLDAEDKTSIDEARRSLTAKIRIFAKDIHDKYIVPPKTTDFALDVFADRRVICRSSPECSII